MKKLFLLLCTVSLFATLSFAQAAGGSTSAPNPGTPAPSSSDKGMSSDSGKSAKHHHHHHHKHHKKAESSDTSKPQ